jgi:hypothetical protein
VDRVPVEEVHQQQRRRIGPLQVVETDHEGSVVADTHEELECRLEQMELGARSRRLEVQQPRQHVVAGPAGPIPTVITKISAEGAQDLDPRPQSRRAGAVPTRPEGGTGLPPLGFLEDLERQSGLAHPGLTGYEHKPADAGERLVEGAGQAAQGLLAADERRFGHGTDYRRLRSGEARVSNSRLESEYLLVGKVKHMILSAYHFDGDPESLMDCHRRMMELFPVTGLDLHVAVTHDRGLTVYDSCPDLATQEAFVASPEFAGALAQVGLTTPRVEVLGEVHFAHLNQSVLR